MRAILTKHITKKRIFLALLIVALVVIYDLPSYKKCQYEYADEAYTSSAEKPDWGRSIITNGLCYVDFIDRHNGFIAALAAAIMAYFTWAIKSISSEQLKHTRKIERAYLSGGGGLRKIMRQVPASQIASVVISGVTTGFINIEQTIDEFALDIHNDGKTVGTLTGYAIHACDCSELVKEGKPKYICHHHIDTFPPGVNKGQYNVTTHPLSIPNCLNPVVYGRFWYQDIWKEEHIFSFILSVRDRDTHSDVTGVSPEYSKWT